MMTEKLLQFIWDRQLYCTDELCTEDGELLHIVDKGKWNHHQGPDFHGAVINISGITWAGNVELHVRTGEWFVHGHQRDPGYDNVILHVVWEHDRTVTHQVPVLELKGRIPHFLLERYAGWMQQLRSVPCQDERIRQRLKPPRQWLEKLIDQRLMIRSITIGQMRKLAGGDWEAVCWWQIARNFGQHVNADAFEELARGISHTVLARHRSQIHQIEALLLGQANLLNAKAEDPYVVLLQREYKHLRRKLNLTGIRGQIRFLRMRPMNFPTIRLAQLAMLIHSSEHWFSQIRQMKDPEAVERMLTVTANDFWHYHYRLEKSSAYLPKTLGKTMVQGIIINSVVPMLYAYGKLMNEPAETHKAMEWLRTMMPERNMATRLFEDEHWSPANAFESQAILELEKNYCEQKRCLECEIGQRMLTESYELPTSQSINNS
jgi:hypothetical protein